MKRCFKQKILILGVLLLSALFISSCADDKLQEETLPGYLAELQVLKDENLALWEDQGISNYRFTFNWSCFCVDTVIQKVDITVIGGVIDTITVTATGEVLTPDVFSGTQFNYQTVEGLFDWIQNEIEGAPYFMAVTYDPDWGYPESAYVNPSAQIADDDRIFFVFGLEEIFP